MEQHRGSRFLIAFLTLGGVDLAQVSSSSSAAAQPRTPRSQLWRWQLLQTPNSAPEFHFAPGRRRASTSLDALGGESLEWKERDAAFEAEGLFCHGRWLGVQVLQSPEDLMYLQQVITRVRPGIVIESGTFRGGLAFFMASVFSHLGLDDSRVLTMDAFDVNSNFHNLDNHPLCPVCMDCVKAYETELWKKHVLFFE
ncbi:unnamed protein product, partial [Polarella glacialis]